MSELLKRAITGSQEQSKEVTKAYTEAHAAVLKKTGDEAQAVSAGQTAAAEMEAFQKMLGGL